MNEPETAETEEATVVLPPFVYVPVSALPQDPSADVDVIVRRTQDGRQALVVYTALDRLVDGCGEHQPWAVVATSEFPAVARRQPFEVIFTDLEMPEELRAGPGAVPSAE